VNKVEEKEKWNLNSKTQSQNNLNAYISTNFKLKHTFCTLDAYLLKVVGMKMKARSCYEKWISLQYLATFSMLYIVGIQVTLTGSATTSPNAVTDEEADVLIKCVSCGLAFIDPMEDNQKYSTDPADTEAKMYNDTCSRHEIMMQNKPEAKSKWVRTCPKGVKSCFWAQGNGIGGWYQGNEHRFRGCADALFIHDNKCTKELQPVTTIEDRLSVDVEVELCYCDKDECNAERPNSATFLSYSVYVHIFLFALSFL